MTDRVTERVGRSHRPTSIVSRESSESAAETRGRHPRSTDGDLNPRAQRPGHRQTAARHAAIGSGGVPSRRVPGVPREDACGREDPTAPPGGTNSALSV